jgi:hemolysin activation/secretion protein
MKHFTQVLAGACVAVVGADMASAQVVTDTAQPDRLDRQDLGLRPRTTDAMAPRAPTVDADEPTGLRVADIRIEGSTLPASLLEKAVKGFIGGPLDGTNIRAIADAVSAVYAKSSVALFSILVPQQTFANGLVRIAAIENSIDEIRISGDNDAKNSKLTQAYAAALAEERPVTRPALERYLLLLNEIPGAVTTPKVLGGDSLNTVKLDLETKRTPIESVITVNTRGAARLGRTQLKGDVIFNGWGYEGNKTTLSATSSSDFERFLSLAAAHSTTFGPSGATVSGSFGYFQTKPEGFSGLEGKGYAAGLQASYPLVRSVKTNVTLSGGLDGVNSDNAFVGQVVSSDRTRALRGAASANGSIGKLAWATSASLSQGVDILGARVSNAAFAEPVFTKANLQAAASRTLGKDWRVQAAATVQASADRLPAAEMLSLGGAAFGRAFESGALSGDRGLAGSLELVRSWTRLGPVKGAETYGFVDGGAVSFEDRPGLALSRYDLASAGAGLRFKVGKETLLGLEGAYKTDVIRDDIDDKDWRMSVSLQSAF